MRRVADTNFQKVIACIPDTIGCVTQFQALSAFAAGCYTSMPKNGENDESFRYVVGTGYWAYVICLLAAIIRVSIHYLTPVPGGGTGCQCVEDLIGVDIDGDGKVGGRAKEREEQRKAQLEAEKKEFEVTLKVPTSSFGSASSSGTHIPVL